MVKVDCLGTGADFLGDVQSALQIIESAICVPKLVMNAAKVEQIGCLGLQVFFLLPDCQCALMTANRFLQLILRLVNFSQVGQSPGQSQGISSLFRNCEAVTMALERRTH